MPLRRLKFEKWKTPEQVKRLNIDFSKRIGGRTFGYVYIGRLFFKDGSSHRVAVKKFHMPITDDKAERYNKVIRNLVKEGVPLPKMGMVKWKGEWYQVSQLFGSTKKGSKIMDFSVDMNSNRDEYINLIANTINAGYNPEFDYVSSTIKKSRIPIDLDLLTYKRSIFAADRNPHLKTYLMYFPIEERKEVIKELISKVKSLKNKQIIAKKFRIKLSGAV